MERTIPGVRDGSVGSPRSSSGGRITPSLPLTPNFSIGSGAGFVSDFVSLGVSSFSKVRKVQKYLESEAINAFGSFGRS
ncbi:MAG: hypothetical protein ACLR2C_02400 [Parasutterella excrementihominis]